MDMIEKIAREIARSRCEPLLMSEIAISLYVDKRWEEYISHATAALKAMREPTPAMIDRFVSRALQVSVHGEGGWSDYARNQWQAMIDGALAGEGKRNV